jgi:hypothetical protein
MSAGQSSFPQLLVSEAVREFDKHFSDATDKNSNIYAQLIALGRKPGFGMASQLATNEPLDSLEQIADFLSVKFSQTLFDVTPNRNLSPDKTSLTLDFQLKPQKWFASLSLEARDRSPEQTFWHACYAHFLLGVYAGALLHFGYKTEAIWDQATGAPLLLKFKLEELDGTWAFTANSSA